MRKVLNCVGQRYERLLVLKQWKGTHSHQKVLAQCDCGVIKEFRLSGLGPGKTRSCGCLHKEVSTKHGLYGSLVYNTWSNMIQRCSSFRSSSYATHGARGITVCERWLKFENFYEDMGDRPEGLELDRIDNDKSYYKENCRWTSCRKNTQNTRRSKYWFIRGKRYDSSYEASEVLGVSQTTIKDWCDGHSWTSKSGVRYDYPPKDGCYSELKYK